MNSGIVAPSAPGIKFHGAFLRFLSGGGTVNHVINNVGGGIGVGK